MIRLLLRNIQCSRTVLATSMHDVSVAEEAGKWNRNPSVQSYERYLFLVLPEFGNNRPTLHILFRSASFRETHRLSAFSDENYVSVQRATAKAFRLSRPTRPASWKYSSNDPGISRWTTNRTSGLSIPIPKAFVATITRHSLFFQRCWPDRLFFPVSPA